MDRAQKEDAITWIRDVFDRNTVIVVANGGLTVAQMSSLRGELRLVGAKMKVVKNRLARIAVSERPIARIGDVFKGPTAIAYAEDPSAAAKAVRKYAKDNEKLRILGGAMGKEVFDAKGVEALASMPSREELIAQIVQTILSPGAQLASAIGAPAADIAGILKTLAEREAA